MAVQPLFVSSGDLVADRRYRWALDYLKQGDPMAAADVLQQVLELAPRFATAWFALAVIRDQAGDREGAISAFRAASDVDPEDYHGARLHLARLGAGEPTPAMTATYVRRLFDQHAPEFDKSLIGHLDYRGPSILLAALEAVNGKPLRAASVLDLGCGTGLAGEVFRPLCDRLVGMDISPGMIEKARSKAIYDQLAVGDLLDFLNGQQERFDLVLAADVFVYCGNLAPIAESVARVVAADGLFAFTVESHEGAGSLLQPTLRYAHAAAYVRDVIAAAPMRLMHLADAATRRERNEWVKGLVAVASALPISAAKPVP